MVTTVRRDDEALRCPRSRWKVLKACSISPLDRMPSGFSLTLSVGAAASAALEILHWAGCRGWQDKSHPFDLRRDLF